MTFAPALTDKEYAEAFSILRTKTTNKTDFLNWLDKNIDSLVPKSDRLSVLSVGAGDGNFDLPAIPIFQSRAAVIEYTALDPNGTMLEQFDKDFRSKQFKDVQLIKKESTFEQYPAGPLTSYDLIHFTHSLYFIANQSHAVNSALNMVPKGGRVLIFNAMHAGIQELRDRYTERARGKQYATFPAEKVKKMLDQEGIVYKFDTIESVIDVTDCFDPKSLTGCTLLNFFLVCNTEKLSPEFRTEILDYIKHISYEQQSKMLMPHPVGVFTIVK